MSAYTDRVTLAPSGHDWELTSALEWEVGRKGSGLVYRIEAGFVSDLATIPAFARLVFDRGDARLAKAAILHDHMLAAGWSRPAAGAEFHDALKADGVAAWRRLVMFLAVALYRFPESGRPQHPNHFRNP